MTVRPVFDLDRIGSGLPASALSSRIAQLAQEGPGLRAVVHAPPGTGKTTVVPPALAEALADARGAGTDTAAEAPSSPVRILVSQPRRVAARAAAHRLAHLSGREVGGAVGYSVRGDRKVSRSTRVEFATTGVVLRRLLHDPELAGIDAIVLDEVHERSLESDLAFAMVRELLELRDDLSLLVMSATLDADDWAARLGDPTDAPQCRTAPVLRVAAQTHPLTVRWSSPPRRAVDDRGVRPDFLTHVASTVDDALARDAGDVLVFAPGHREVDRVAAQVRSRHGERVEVLTLTGSTPRSEQDRVLAGPESDGGGARRRVVVATSVAESALTVPGVRIVVDSCLSRVPHFDTGRGVGGLTTVRVSKASGDQRAGRAAREAPGTVWRCCAESEWAAFPAHSTPEVLAADLTGAVLDLAVWGSPGGFGLPLPTPLPDLPLRAATRTLHGLGALESPDPDARATGFGAAVAAVPADPRTARGLLLATPVIGARQAAECAALLSLDSRAADGDLTALLRRARSGRDAAPAGWGHEVRRLERLAAEHADTTSSAPPPGGGTAADAPSGRAASAARDLGIVLALSRPDMIARLREGADEDYHLTSGTGAQLQRGSALHGEEWIVVADAAVVGERTLVRAGAGIDEQTALWAASALRSVRESADWADGRIRGRRTDALGAIILSSTPVGVTEESAAIALTDAVRSALLRLAHGDPAGAAFTGLAREEEVEAFEALRGRLGLLHHVRGAPWPAVGAVRLADTLEDWLGLEIQRAARAFAPRRGAGSGPQRTVRLRLHEALQGLLPWPEAADLDRLVPPRVPVPSGSAVRLTYPRPEEHTGPGPAADHGPADPRSADAPGRAGSDAPGRAGSADARTAPPVLAVKLQEMFGVQEGPAVIDGQVPVLVHLLSPARRPLAVTADLASFWDGAYAHVRAENRGRYPKHPWPKDPRTATPTAHTSKRAARA